MKSFRENPDGEENQEATKQSEREVFALKMMAKMSAEANGEDDPCESEEYEKFVESMVPHCRCRAQDRPCDGVLAGGICDNIQDRDDPDDDLRNDLKDDE